MNELIWITKIAPDALWPILVFLSLAAIALTYMTLADKIPYVAQYARMIRVVAVVTLLVGIYFQGVVASENRWEARVKELERKVKNLEVESKETNKQLEKTLEEKKKLIEEKGKETIKYINRWRDRLVPVQTPSSPQKPATAAEAERERIVIETIQRCPVPKELVDAHNMIAETPGKEKRK